VSSNVERYFVELAAKADDAVLRMERRRSQQVVSWSRTG
jgi:hypothetical protein